MGEEVNGSLVIIPRFLDFVVRLQSFIYVTVDAMFGNFIPRENPKIVDHVGNIDRDDDQRFVSNELQTKMRKL